MYFNMGPCLGCLQVVNLYTTTSLAWKTDGSRVAVGGLTGTLALYETCLRRTR
jgi:intraflagellar transport protein 172